MGLHRGREAFARHVQKRLVEGAHQHDGPFGEPGVFGEERFVFNKCEARFPRQRLGLITDLLDARGGVEHYGIAFKLVDIIGDVLDGEQCVAVEAMTASLVASG